jgi:uncharacterized OsmC-like protein
MCRARLELSLVAICACSIMESVPAYEAEGWEFESL